MSLVLSVVDLTYVGFVALQEPVGEMRGHDREIGLREGALVNISHVGDEDIRGRFGLRAFLHWPAFVPLPVFPFAEPDSAGIKVAVWFPLVLAWGVHAYWRARTRAKLPRASGRAS